MRFVISKNTATPTSTSSKQSLIEEREALATVNSSQSNPSRVVIRRSMSSLSERQASELLLDNSDRLSEMIMGKGNITTVYNCDYDNDCDIDYDSDCECDLEV
ncbi:unnamed protein product [Cylindrotheca closterium]|uniref:Uncharacterized protein n=1 Tax=Cylindrotheca closterium TaxID=2856 RepID=A0AAD2FML7_9STRA|nr:unnamed protein product [Cylindrotheca closterium]